MDTDPVRATDPDAVHALAARTLPDGRTLRAFAIGWLIAAYPNDATRRVYRDDVRSWWEFCSSSGVDPFAATRADGAAYFAYLEQYATVGGNRTPGPGYSPRTIRRMVSVATRVTAALRTACGTGPGPAPGVRTLAVVPRPGGVDRVRVAAGTVAALVDGAGRCGSRIGPYPHTAARAVALIGLAWTTALPLRRLLALHAEHVADRPRDAGGMLVDRFPLPDEIAAPLADALRTLVAAHPTGTLLRTASGRPLAGANVPRLLDTAAERAGIAAVLRRHLTLSDIARSAPPRTRVPGDDPILWDAPAQEAARREQAWRDAGADAVDPSEPLHPAPARSGEHPHGG